MVMSARKVASRARAPRLRPDERSEQLDLMLRELAHTQSVNGRRILGMLTALVTVLFAGVIALLALPMDKQRRDYALQVADRFIRFPAVLVGARSEHNDVDAEQHRPPPAATSLSPTDTE